MKHFYSDSDINPSYQFPGHGQILECSCFSDPPKREDIGKFARENCDILIVAWLMKWKEVKESGNTDNMAAFKKAAAKIRMSINFRQDTIARQMVAYQYKEDEDKIGERLGHSPLTRSRELHVLQDRP